MPLTEERRAPSSESRLDLAAPIIVTGAGRSGSTLICAMLDTHPQVSFAGENNFLLPKLWGGFFDAPKGAADSVYVDWTHHWQTVREMIPKMGIERFREVERSRIAEILRPMIADVLRLDPSRRVWGFKEIWMGSYRHPGLGWESYDRVYPGATWIHLIRNPLRQAASVLSIPYYARCRSDPGFILRQIEDWVRMTEFSRQRRSTGRYFEVRYEDLVAEPNRQLEPILKSVGLEWSDDCLEALKTRFVASAKDYSDIVREALNGRVACPGFPDLVRELGYAEEIEAMGFELIDGDAETPATVAVQADPVGETHEDRAGATSTPYFTNMPERVARLERLYEPKSSLYRRPTEELDDLPSEIEVARLWGTLVCLLQPRRILESGTYEGYTACYLAAALKDIGLDGHVTTIDPTPRDHLWNGSDLESYITWIPKTSRQALPDLQETTFDLILLDGDHTYRTVLWELVHFDRLLRVGGHFLLHDAIYHDGVGAAITQLYENPRFEVITLDTPRAGLRLDFHEEEMRLGATIVRKIADGPPYFQIDESMLDLPHGSQQSGSVLRSWQQLRLQLIGFHDGIRENAMKLQEVLTDKTLLRDPAGRIFLVERGAKRHIRDEETLAALGLCADGAVDIDALSAWHIPDGPDIADQTGGR